MSEREFENYLKLIGKLLQLSRGEQEQITGELRDHLQSRVSELESQGNAHEEAVSLALEEFGDAAVMAKNFQTVLKLKRRRWMMRFATLSMASIFLMAIFTMAMWPSNARFGSPEIAKATANDNLTDNQERVEIDDAPNRQSDATRRNMETEQKMRQVVSLNYDETPWSEIEQELEERGRFNIFLGQSARDDSLTEDEPLTFKLMGIPLEKALLMLLAEKNATFHIDHGIVVIISRDDAEDPRYMKVKMFNCRDLIENLDLVDDQPLAAIAGLLGQPGGGGAMGMGRGNGSGSGADGGGAGLGGRGIGGGSNGGSGSPGGGSFGGSRSAGNKKPKTREDLLLDVVKSMITPEEWVDTGQGLADTKIVNGVLIVKHRQAALAEIESLLKDLVYQVNTNEPFDKETGAETGSVSGKAKPNKNLPTPAEEARPEKDPFAVGNSVNAPFADDGSADDDPFGVARNAETKPKAGRPSDR